MKKISPILNSLLLSLLSPHDPDGSIKSAVANKKEVMIQLSSMAVSERSLSILGRAMFTADTKNVPMKEVMDTTISMESPL